MEGITTQYVSSGYRRVLLYEKKQYCAYSFNANRDHLKHKRVNINSFLHICYFNECNGFPRMKLKGCIIDLKKNPLQQQSIFRYNNKILHYVIYSNSLSCISLLISVLLIVILRDLQNSQYRLDILSVLLAVIILPELPLLRLTS